jgi:hypothetical protein
VESRTRCVFLHWFPGWRARRSTYFTRLLSRRELRRLLPGQAHLTGGLLAATLTASGPAPVLHRTTRASTDRRDKNSH